MDIFQQRIHDFDSEILSNISIDLYNNGNINLKTKLNKDDYILVENNNIINRINFLLENINDELFLLDIFQYDIITKKIEWKNIKVKKWIGYHFYGETTNINTITGDLYFEANDNNIVKIALLSPIAIESLFYIQKYILDILPLSDKNIIDNNFLFYRRLSNNN